MCQKSLTIVTLWWETGHGWSARRHLTAARPFLGHQESQNSFDKPKCELTWKDQAFEKPAPPRLTSEQVQFVLTRALFLCSGKNHPGNRGRSQGHVGVGGSGGRKGFGHGAPRLNGQPVPGQWDPAPPPSCLSITSLKPHISLANTQHDLI